jgi:hypothetical protein
MTLREFAAHYPKVALFYGHALQGIINGFCLLERNLDDILLVSILGDHLKLSFKAKRTGGCIDISFKAKRTGGCIDRIYRIIWIFRIKSSSSC